MIPNTQQRIYLSSFILGFLYTSMLTWPYAARNFTVLNFLVGSMSMIFSLYKSGGPSQKSILVTLSLLDAVPTRSRSGCPALYQQHRQRIVHADQQEFPYQFAVVQIEPQRRPVPGGYNTHWGHLRVDSEDELAGVLVTKCPRQGIMLRQSGQAAQRRARGMALPLSTPARSRRILNSRAIQMKYCASLKRGDCRGLQKCVRLWRFLIPKAARFKKMGEEERLNPANVPPYF
jgi:hypothetical protein